MGRILLRLAGLALLPVISLADERRPVADTHVHYNWDQAEIITPEEVLRRIEAGRVPLAVVASTPSAMALQLKALAGDRIVALFSPYTHADGKRDWYRDDNVIEQARRGLATGLYEGIGEVHFMTGTAPKFDNPVFQELLKLAVLFDVPLVIHVDAASADPLARLCASQPLVRFQFAHAGGILGADEIEKLINRCDNLMIDLSARDPWRYGGLTDDDGKLLRPWFQLLQKHPERFMVGTDPVWSVTRTQRWDQADEGWDHHARLLAYHRDWLEELPEPIAHRIAYANAARFYRRKGVTSP